MPKEQDWYWLPAHGLACARWRRCVRLIIVSGSLLIGLVPAVGWGAEPTPLRVDESFERGALGPHIEMLEDLAGRWSIDDVSSLPTREQFHPPAEAEPTLGFTHSAHWVRFALTNTADDWQVVYLEQGYALIDRLDLYVEDARGTYEHREAGDLLPFADREVDYRNFVFELRLPARSTRHVYLRYKTESSMVIALTCWSAIGLAEKINDEQWGLGIYYGILAVMAVYYLFIYSRLRDTSYLFYVLFIVSAVPADMALVGLAYQWLWPDWPWWGSRATPMCLFMAAMSLVLFAREFLQTRSVMPVLHRILTWVLLLSVVGVGLSLFASYAWAIRCATVVVVGGAVVLVVTGLESWRQGYKAARYFLLANTAFLGAVILMALRNLGVLGTGLLTDQGPHIGGALQVVLLAFALADRIKFLQDEIQSVNAQRLDTMRRLTEAEKMATLGGLVSGFTHDISTPIGLCVTLASDLNDRSRTAGKKYEEKGLKRSDLERFMRRCDESTESLMINAMRAGDLVTSLKSVSVDQGGEARRVFSVKTYMDTILMTLQPVLTDVGVKVVVQCADDLEIDSYPGAFSQVVTNLVVHGTQHSFTEGQPGSINFVIKKDDWYTEIVYQDDGKGIASQHVHRIFDSFFTTRADTGETGLGLYILYTIVTQTMGGSIECESVEGQGTAFIIRIPHEHFDEG